MSLMLTNEIINTSLSIGIAYIIGSISSAILICKLMRLPDPRTQGSSNPGATNVLRIGGKKPAIIVLLSDLLKGTFAVLIARAMGMSPNILAFTGLAAVLGHMYPVFFKFKGGKGVATAFGSLIGLSPLLAAIAALIWLSIAFLTRYSSLAALITFISVPFLSIVLNQPAYFSALAILACFILWRHRSNISRLWHKTESKIKIGKKTKS